jgi:porphobilinogen deaminase
MQVTMTTANLDALIPREDFEIKEESTQSQSIQAIQIRDLEREAFFYCVLRKA